MVKIAIITYSLYGHIDILAKAVQEGITEAGGTADIYRVEETLPPKALKKLLAPPKPKDIPVAGKDILKKYDAFLFGIPTRYGNVPAQWANFWDQTGGIWVKGNLEGKAAGFFTSTASFGGGQDSTIKNSLDYLSHHGMIIIPLGYKSCFAELSCIDEIHGAGPWGAGTLAGPDGTRTASDLELRIASIQGHKFFNIVKRLYDNALKENNSYDNMLNNEPMLSAKKKPPNVPEQKITQNQKSSNKNECCVII
ncbi:uncharacterized protein PWA37_005316 [Arxiozyma heterogenica]|uniref:Flavodoxin-like domain-containing protein n=1 Tax=Arxiozyma heterogenica TaxID=278026 RepID=A0AAN7WQ97_9SACH|nr:hypothetical protein RI543_000247 [Kazachstania heterogenica]